MLEDRGGDVGHGLPQTQVGRPHEL